MDGQDHLALLSEIANECHEGSLEKMREWLGEQIKNPDLHYKTRCNVARDLAFLNKLLGVTKREDA